ncbi:MAG: GNAT family N-acetyltransferase [Promethearchaeota archaeon]|jgi:ribosomal protein S18 acetylase RimI-like enzyme
MEFILLNKFAESEILETQNRAFSDYEVPMQLSLEAFKYFNRRRGVCYDLSLGALIDGNLIGFILNAVDIWEGKLTAYDCGTGIIPEFRQKGIGNQLFNNLLPILKTKKIKRYLLEVIQSNTAAYNLYRKRNFQVTREFDCLQVERTQLENEFQNKETELRDFNYDIKNVERIDWKIVKKFQDFSASWQNSEFSIQRVSDSFGYLSAFYKKKIVGYMVYEPSGGITQLAIHPKHRNQKIGLNFIKNLLEKCPNSEKFSIINIDTQDTNLTDLFTRLGFKSFATQFEMVFRI